MYRLPVLVLIVACSSFYGTGAPFAEKIEVSGLSGATLEKAVALRSIPSPPRSAVPFPAYPASRQLMANDPHGGLASVLLVSRDSPREIVNWYLSTVPRLKAFETSIGTIMMERDAAKLDLNSDSEELYRAEQIIVTDAGDSSLSDLIPDYAAIIEVRYVPRGD